MAVLLSLQLRRDVKSFYPFAVAFMHCKPILHSSIVIPTAVNKHFCIKPSGTMLNGVVNGPSIRQSIFTIVARFHQRLNLVPHNQFSFQQKLLHNNASSRTKYSGAHDRNYDTVAYVCSLVIFMLGMSYAAVPLYRMFCKASGLGGDPKLGHKTDAVESMVPIRERQISVMFNADKHSAMDWNFKPSQKRITVVPGETALAFYTARNPTDKPIVGVATYNVVPFQAGLYFNKIQCFCFEEQWLNPHEEVDMPVFFYIDPEFDDDPVLANVSEIVLSYTFFKAEEGQTIPLPGFMKSKSLNNSNPSTSSV